MDDGFNCSAVIYNRSAMIALAIKSLQVCVLCSILIETEEEIKQIHKQSIIA